MYDSKLNKAGMCVVSRDIVAAIWRLSCLCISTGAHHHSVHRLSGAHLLIVLHVSGGEGRR